MKRPAREDIMGHASSPGDIGRNRDGLGNALSPEKNGGGCWQQWELDRESGRAVRSDATTTTQEGDRA